MNAATGGALSARDSQERLGLRHDRSALDEPVSSSHRQPRRQRSASYSRASRGCSEIGPVPRDDPQRTSATHQVTDRLRAVRAAEDRAAGARRSAGARCTVTALLRSEWPRCWPVQPQAH